MSTSHVHTIIQSLGSEEIQSALGLSRSSISEAKRDGVFPARWYAPLREMCAARNVECPIEAFRWINGDKKVVPGQVSKDGVVNGPAS